MDLTNIKFCPICKTKQNKFFGQIKKNKVSIKYDICRNCTLIYMNPRPSQEWYNKTYKEDFWDSKKREIGINRSNIKNQLFKQTQWAKKIGDFLLSVNFNKKERPKILEIGCSYGKIVKDLAYKFNGEAWGVEPSDEAMSFAKDIIGIKIYARNMDEVFEKSDENQFDLILFSHCLENITDPLNTLKKVFKLLKDDGILFIDTPNNLFRRSWHIYHPYCYSIFSISELLYQTNFIIKKTIKTGRPKIFLGNFYLSIIASKNKDKNIPRTFTTSRQFFIRMFIGDILHKLLVKSPLGVINRKLGGIIWKNSSKEISFLEKCVK